MKDKTRALRRHHAKRIKAKFARRLKPQGRMFYTEDFDFPAYLGKLARTPQMCSCYGCGNQRKWEGDKPLDKAFVLLHVLDEE